MTTFNSVVSRKTDLLVSLIIVVLVVAVFGPVVTHDFIGYDDPFYVTDNPTVKRGLTAEGVAWAFRHGADAAYWTPITFLSHMLDVQLFGLRPGGHHLTSVVVHALNSVLLYFVLLSLTQERWPSALASALFAVHPLRVESVAWIAERKDLISGLFLLLCVVAHAWWSRRGGWWRYSLVVALFVLGLMSKPMLVTVPFLLLILDFWPLRRLQRSPKRSIRWLLLEKAPMVFIAIGFSALTIIAQEQAGALRSLEQFPLTFRLGNAIVSYARYLGKTVWPVNLAVFYPPPDFWPIAIVGLAVLLLVTITAIALTRARSMPYLLGGWLWFVIALLPVIGFVQVGRQAMADRYTYIAHIGLFVAISWSAWAIVQKSKRTGNIIAGIMIGVILLCALRTGDQVRHWRDSQTLFEHALHVTEGNTVAMVQVGNARVRSGRLVEGETLYRQALQLQPNYGMAHLNLGNLLIRRREFAAAAEHYEAALCWQENLPRAQLGLALAHSGMKQYDVADADFAKALQRAPQMADAQLAWGMSLMERGRPAEAADHFRAALKINPNLTAAQRELDKPRPASGPTSTPAAVEESSHNHIIRPPSAQRIWL